MNKSKRISGRLAAMARLPIIGFITIAVLSGILLSMDLPFNGIWILLAVAVAFAIVAGVLALSQNRTVLADMTSFAENLNDQLQIQCENLELPIAMVDEEGEILWQNERFQVISGKETNLIELFPELHKRDFQGYDQHESVYVTKDTQTYRLDARNIPVTGPNVDNDLVKSVAGSRISAIYLYDETRRIYCEQELEDEKMIAGLIYLDNYDEALVSVEEVRRTLLVALIDRKINRFFQNMDAIVRKTEKDKYFVVIKQKYIQALKEDKFGILDDVKSVNIGNEMSVTLSIGMGMNGGDYTKNFEYARTAIDMALARGGDQAVVKDGDRIQYFGGKSLQVEKNTRVKARVKAHALRELMENKERVVVMGHKLGDIDCFGAAIGIYRSMSALGKKTQIVINDVTNSVRPLMDQFIGNPEYPEDLFLKGNQAYSLMNEDTVLVVVDVNRISITEEEGLLQAAKTIVVFDHHRQSNETIDNAVLSYVEPYASSTCEMVAEILQYISENVKLKPLEANALYAGIVLDTNNFTTQTGVRTFEAAAFLKRNGADVVKVRKLFRDNMEDYKAKAMAVHNAEIFRDCFAISICQADSSESPTVIGAQSANELLNIVGIKASIVLTQYNGKIYISARSIDEVNVQLIMEKLGGGGHLSNAGAQLVGCTLEEAKALIKETLSQMLADGDI